MTVTAFSEALEQGRNETDRTPMERAYDLHAGPLLRFLLGQTRRQRPAAEDLLQETMMRAWRHLDSMPSADGDARKWLFAIARNVAIDAARKRRVRPQEVNLAEASTVRSADFADSTLALQDLRTAIRRLAKEQRVVLGELHLNGLSIEETAAKLGIPAGTVKSRAHYGKRILREALMPPA